MQTINIYKLKTGDIIAVSKYLKNRPETNPNCEFTKAKIISLHVGSQFIATCEGNIELFVPDYDMYLYQTVLIE